MNTNPDRPLSPHLQIYNLPLSARLSITHRITGVILAAGTLLITALLIAAAMGEVWYNYVMDLFMTDIGRIIMFGWSAALYYHLLSGIRHMLMDTGRLISHTGAMVSGWVIILGSIGLTAATWYCVLIYR
ncbi:MAG: succinate dehydrogenase, cytochrome b556 subunit [Alphaproteobacteria bacterium]|nr:succinate dehydrogenase, cytochrome b556 subunit [Alphaproteobacteria bacterium]